MDKLLTVEQLSVLLGIQPSTIYKWTHEGFIPHVKLGRLVRFNEATVMKWVERRSEAGRATRCIDVRDMGV